MNSRDSRDSRGSRRAGGAFSPVVVFAVLLIVTVGGAALAVMLTRPDPTQPRATTSPQGSPTPPDHSLTDAEAITRFKELDRLRRDAYERADPTVVSDIFTSEGRIDSVVHRELRTLQRDGVRSESTFKTLSIEVLRNQGAEIHIRQVVVVAPRFVNAAGRDVTGHAPPERQTIEWTLAWTGESWLIGDSVIKQLKPR